MKNAYIQACIQLSESGKDPEALVKGLGRTLKERGHEKLYLPVLKGVLRESARKSAAATELTIVDKKSYAELRNAIDLAIQSHHFDPDYSIREDTSIIGGFILSNKNLFLDHSYKQRLIRLYRSFS